MALAGTQQPKASPPSSASIARSRIARRSLTTSLVSPKATPLLSLSTRVAPRRHSSIPRSRSAIAPPHGHTHQLLIFEHKHKITNSKFEKKQAPRERKKESWILKERRKTKIQTQIEQVMDLERTKKKKYKMRVNESRPWLG